MPAPKSDRNSAIPVVTRVTRAERRRQILSHAKTLFLKQGFSATSLEQVAQASGISEAVLLKHFAGKQALFVLVLQEIRTATLLCWETLTVDLVDPIQKIRALIDHYLQSVQNHSAEFRILHRTLVESDDPEVMAEIRAFYLECETILVRIIQVGQQNGVIKRTLNPRVGAWELIRSALGYTMTLPLQMPILQEADYLKSATDCLLNSLLKTDV